MKRIIGKTLSFFGIGVLYLLVCLPDIRRWKIGVTALHVGSEKRAKQVTKSLPGILIPVFFVVVPGYYQIEAYLHWICKPFHAPFKSGNGGSEIYFFQGALYAFFFMASIWVFEVTFLEWLLGVNYFWPFIFKCLSLFRY